MSALYLKSLRNRAAETSGHQLLLAGNTGTTVTCRNVDDELYFFTESLVEAINVYVIVLEWVKCGSRSYTSPPSVTFSTYWLTYIIG
jgi:hypothetical protein